jgi:hypothetical protein
VHIAANIATSGSLSLKIELARLLKGLPPSVGCIHNDSGTGDIYNRLEFTGSRCGLYRVSACEDGVHVDLNLGRSETRLFDCWQEWGEELLTAAWPCTSYAGLRHTCNHARWTDLMTLTETTQLAITALVASFVAHLLTLPQP